MTPDEAGKLLALAAAFDNRKPSHTAMKAWAVALHDIPLDTDALNAVARYYGTLDPAEPGKKWIQPHHVRAHRAKIRNGRDGDIVGPGQPAEIPAADPDDTAAYLAAVREQRRRAISGQVTSFANQRSLNAALGEEPKGAPGGDYRRLRAEWEQRRAADKEAAHAARLAQLANEASARAEDRRLTYAQGLLLAVSSEAADAAIAAARTELGADASREDVIVLAARRLDVDLEAPAELDEDAVKALARHGCPNGCPIGTHVPPCRWASAADEAAEGAS
jgi:hypothetical protein